MIKKLVSAALLSVASIVVLGSQETQGAAIPSILNFLPTAELVLPKSESGPDGNNRFLWDYFTNSGTGTVYQGSVLWILDPTGNIIGAGDTMIPATVGALASATATSFTQLHVNADSSTTVAFQFGGGAIVGSKISQFGTWTYNAQGKLIAASGATGFKGLQIADIRFQNDFLVVTFIPEHQQVGSPVLGQGPYTVWVIDQFGHLVSAVGPQGPYTNYLLGSVTLSGSSSAPNQLWHWLSVTSTASPGFQLSVQEFRSTGANLSGFTYGPF